MVSLKTVTLTLDLSSLTTVQQGLGALRIATDRALEMIQQQVTEQLAEAALEEARATKKTNGSAEAVQ